jgi:hypothetical protein
LYINDNFIEEIAFTAPNNTTWMSYIKTVSLNAGDNKVAIEGVWNWMSFDYIAIAVEGDTNDLESVKSVDLNSNQLVIVPNPVGNQGVIHLNLVKSGNLKLGVYDITGRYLSTLVDEYRASGKNDIEFSTSNLDNGNYLLKLMFENSDVLVRKFIVNR